MRIREAGRDGERPVIGADRSLEAPELAQLVAPIVVSVGAIRSQGNRALVACERVLMPGEARERKTVIEVRIGITGLERDRGLVGRDGLGVPDQIPQNIAAIEVRLGQMWVERKGCVEARHRRLVLRQMLQGVAVIDEQRYVARIDAQRFTEECQCTPRLISSAARRFPTYAARGNARGLPLQQLCIQRGGFFESPLLVQGEGVPECVLAKRGSHGHGVTRNSPRAREFTAYYGRIVPNE